MMKKSKKILFLLLIFFLMFNSHEVYPDEGNEGESNFEKFDDMITVKAILGASIRIVRMSFDDYYGDPHYVDYTANIPAAAGFAVTCKNFDIEYLTNGTNGSYKDDECGKTDYFNSKVSYYSDNLAVFGYYQRIKGYYVSDSGGLKYPDAAGDDYAKRRDLSLHDGGISLTWKSSDDFSYKAAMTQTERQIKSGGTWLTGVQYNYLRMRTGYSLIPDAQEADYRINACSFRGGDFHSLSIVIGGAYTLIFLKNFYASVTISIAPNYTYQRWKLGSDIKNEHAVSVLGSYPGWMNIGYNGDGFLCGLTFFWMNGVSHQYISGAGIETVENIDIGLFAGTRF